MANPASKLVASKGTIDKVSTFEAGSMDVQFKRAAIATSGDVGQVRLAVGDQMVEMTYAQALAFAQEVMKRCQ